MAVSLHLWDQTLPGTRAEAGILELDRSTTTARELILLRLAQPPTRVLRNLVDPEESERILNGLRENGLREPVDSDSQLKRALKAFEKNAFLLFVNGRQVTDLDQPIELRPESEIEFIKLLPLIGGAEPCPASHE